MQQFYKFIAWRLCVVQHERCWSWEQQRPKRQTCEIVCILLVDLFECI